MLIKNIELNIDVYNLKKRIEDASRDYITKSKFTAIAAFVCVILGVAGCYIITMMMKRAEDYSKTKCTIICGGLVIIDIIFMIAIIWELLEKSGDSLFSRLSYTNFLEVVSYVGAENYYPNADDWLLECPYIEAICPTWTMGYVMLHEGNWTCQMKVAKRSNDITVRCIDADSKKEVTLTPKRYIVSPGFTADREDDLVMCFMEDEIVIYDKTFLNKEDSVSEFRK